MRQHFVQDELRMRHHAPATRMSPAVFKGLVVGYLTEHGIAEIVRDMPGTAQARWTAANGANRWAEIEAGWRERAADRIRELHTRGISAPEAARQILASC